MKKGLLGVMFVFVFVSTSAFSDCALDGGVWSTVNGNCYNSSQDLSWSVDTGHSLGYGHNWSKAKANCAARGLGWRLPKLIEMLEATQDNGAAHLHYGYGENNLRWTSDLGTGKNKKKVYVEALGSGEYVFATQTSQLYHFCVKAGQ